MQKAPNSYRDDREQVYSCNRPKEYTRDRDDVSDEEHVTYGHSNQQYHNNGYSNDDNHFGETWHRQCRSTGDDEENKIRQRGANKRKRDMDEQYHLQQRPPASNRELVILLTLFNSTNINII